MLLLGGASDAQQDGMGSFQESPQVDACKPFCKWSIRVDSAERIPFYVEQAVRCSITGRPGAVYLDFPGNLLNQKLDMAKITGPPRCPDPPVTLASPADVNEAFTLLRSAERPLVIVGKGAAYAGAAEECRTFLDKTQIPFLSTPMGKGTVSDTHPNNVIAARTLALKSCDVVLLVGARLNWILHFGLPPRWAPGVKVIQIDISPEEFNKNVPTTVALLGHAKGIMGQLVDQHSKDPWTFPSTAGWRKSLQEKIDTNTATTDRDKADRSVPMNYYVALQTLQDRMRPEMIVSSEGANTMDIGRTILNNHHPRHRLDAATFGTMGVGLAQAIAAAVVHPDKKVVAVEGDSAVGFSMSEFEVMCRYNLNITIVVINNNGIGGGPKKIKGTPRERIARFPVNAYLPEARYERVMQAFGGWGYFVNTPDSLATALDEALAYEGPSLVNCMINPRSDRKKQEFDWNTRGTDLEAASAAPAAKL
jgi:2-hydroxyacyl-CoA lyase 1